jgi:hypothetical protein
MTQQTTEKQAVYLMLLVARIMDHHLSTKNRFAISRMISRAYDKFMELQLAFISGMSKEEMADEVHRLVRKWVR